MSRSRVLLAAALAVAIVVLAAGAAWLTLVHGGRAVRGGEVGLAGLAAPVRVSFDDAGVPYVDASSAEDLATALGWLHAGDRFTQMELGRRVAAGRVAELVGRRAVGLDTSNRTLRYRETAERMWQAAGPESRRWLEAYARGVNGWLASHRHDLPPGLVLIAGPGFVPEPWTPVDSLGFVMLMANDLSFWDGRPEEERYRWLVELGVERTRDLLGGDPHVPEEIVALAERERGRREAAPTLAPLDGLGQGGPAEPPASTPATATPGSNDWALAGERTASGAPLLANDPHLGLALPGTWYQVHLRAPGYAVAGVSIPGVPGVVIGHSADLAWALTNVMLDDHDLFFEQLDERPDGGQRVRRGAGWAPVETRRETIRVKGGDDVVLTLRSTDRGPLLDPTPDGLPPRSLAWTLYTPGDPMAAFLGLARAATLEEALRALDGYVGPAQNLLLAHRDGGILWTILGRLPERASGDGWLPSPGWVPAYRWRGLRARAANPAIVSPPDGLLVTANDRIVPPSYPFPITADYDTPHRARRIRERLTAGRAWDVAATAELQTDTVSLFAREVVAAALAAGDDTGGEAPSFAGAAGRAAAMLAGWDGRMAAGAGGGAAPAALYAVFERDLGLAIFADEAGTHHLGPGNALVDRGRLLRALRGEMSAEWFDDVTTPGVREGKREIVGRALTAAWRDAGERLGDDPAGWDYGTIHTLTLDHPLSGAPWIGRFFTLGPVAVPGSASTVAAFGGRWRDRVIDVTYGPSMRFVADLGDWDRSVLVLPAGESGQPWDPHYRDQLPLYLAGRTRPFPWTPAAIAAAAVSHLVLTPVPTPGDPDA